jgi:hypothetical protein
MPDRPRPRTLLLAALLVFLAGPAWAKTYKYTDAQGRVHFTDTPTHVPEAYLGQLEKFDTESDSGDPNSWFSAKVPLGLDRFQPGQPEFEKLRGGMEHWMSTWGYLFIAAGLAWGIITLISVFHAFANQRIIWGILNFLSYISVPIYLVIHFDRYPMAVRALLVLGWGAPFIAAPFVLRAGMTIASGQ